MFKKGYVATSEELFKHTSGGLKIDSSLCMLQPAAVAYRREHGFDVNTVPRYIDVRPGLKESINFFGSMHSGKKSLIAVSDRTQTRYYCIGVVPRQTIMLDSPSKSIESAMRNLFCDLMSDDRAQTQKFYSCVADIIKGFFIHENVPQSFTVEGKYRKSVDIFVASLDWSPEDPDNVVISSTIDRLPSRKVSLSLHPIAKVHELCTG